MKNVVRSLVSISLLLTSALALPTEKGFPITDLVGKDLSLYEYARQRFASRDLSKRQYGSDTYNQLTDGSGCRDISIIYARGTGMPGNVGSVEGPAWFNGLASRLGGTSRLAIQGVNYPATVSGFLAGGDAGGTTAMLNLVKDVSSVSATKPSLVLTRQTAARCPNTKIIMGGYSQGGQLTHSSTQLMDAATASRVTASMYPSSLALLGASAVA